MATLKFLIRRENQRSDKTWNVVIRLTHNRSIRYIATSIFVKKEDLTKSYNIKNQLILDRCNDILFGYRKKMNRLNMEFNDIDIDAIANYLKAPDISNGKVDFVAFSRKWIDKHSTELKGVRNYTTSLNAFCAFMGGEKILCEEVTVKTLTAFQESLEGRTRAQSLYTSKIVKLFNEAKDYYNDEDNGIVRIKHSLAKYKPPHNDNPEKRALSVEEIKAIFDLPYNNRVHRGLSSRHDFSKDCFMMSFCLLGMNSADIYDATEFDGEYITYYRVKTRDRRSDKAKMVVRVPKIIRPVFEKYRDDERVFLFHKKCNDGLDFNRSVNKGLKEVGKELDIEGLQFYAARHSMATIAINEVGIDKYTVNDMLCHLDPSMRVTEMYIKKDFRNINEANRKLMEYVFGEGSY